MICVLFAVSSLKKDQAREVRKAGAPGWRRTALKQFEPRDFVLPACHHAEAEPQSLGRRFSSRTGKDLKSWACKLNSHSTASRTLNNTSGSLARPQGTPREI